MVKYEITDIAHPDNSSLHRIKALIDIPSYDIKAGDLGGYVQSKSNLSQEGNCWVLYGNAKVYGNAWVSGDAWVYGNAEVSGNAWVYGDARVYGDAWVYGNAEVSGDARVYGNAWVSDAARVYGNAEVYGAAKVYGDAKVFGDAEVFGDVEVSSPSDILTIFPIGSRAACLTILRNKTCRTGCFYGTVDEFLAAVQTTHGDNEYAKQYQCIIKCAYEYFGWERG